MKQRPRSGKSPQKQEGWTGYLPAQAPLANPYVPFQKDNPPQYEARKGLVRGTMFPGLDLPFMGMVNNKPLAETCMSKLQMLAFGIQELALYLDTHREDREALELYRNYQKMYRACAEEYKRTHGPMTHMSVSDSETYDWLDDPWPWEISKNKEA